MSEIDIELEHNETNLSISLIETETEYKKLSILNAEDKKMPERDNLKFINFSVYDDGLDKTVAEIETLTNVELEELLSID